MLRLDVLESECDNINELMRVIALDIRSEENQVTQQQSCIQILCSRFSLLLFFCIIRLRDITRRLVGSEARDQ